MCTFVRCQDQAFSGASIAVKGHFGNNTATGKLKDRSQHPKAVRIAVQASD